MKISSGHRVCRERPRKTFSSGTGWLYVLMMSDIFTANLSPGSSLERNQCSDESKNEHRQSNLKQGRGDSQRGKTAPAEFENERLAVFGCCVPCFAEIPFHN